MRLVGGGLRLTAAGYLPPAVVERLVADLDLEIEFVGKGNREDYTMPVYHLRESATALGLVRKSKGVLSVTKAGQKVVDDPVGLLSHIRSRLPLGREFERDAGLLALLVTAAGQSWRQHHDAATPIYRDLGAGTTQVDASRPGPVARVTPNPQRAGTGDRPMGHP